MKAPFKIEKSDHVTIAAQGIKVTGTVVAAEYYGEEGWQIEMKDANVSGGYSIYKQRYDGGTVTHVNGKNVCAHEDYFKNFDKTCCYCGKKIED